MSYNFINGRRVEGSGATCALHGPSSGDKLDTFVLAEFAEVDAAVQAAERAFPDWSGAVPSERATALLCLAGILRDKFEELAQLETRQTGKSIRLAREFDIPGTIDNAVFFAGSACNLEGKAAGEYSPGHTSMIRREALGVIGAISPWNYPLQMAGWKVLPAIAAGNTIVLKPSDLTPGTSMIFAESCIEAGIPAGVVNVVTGTGNGAGSALVNHADVGMVSFTGSTPVGRRIMAESARTGKRIHLELGGKAPFVVFDDADLHSAIRGAVAAATINAGQDCTAAACAYVQRPLYNAFVEGVAALMQRIVIGPSLDPETDMGSQISWAHRDRINAMVQQAKGDGARIVTGGAAPDGPLSRGAYYLPTLIVDAAQESSIVQDEIFGPVLVVMPFDSDEQGYILANDSPYGLAASAWTSDVIRAMQASRTLKAGCVWINDHVPIVSEMPHGGIKASGFGKDMGSYSFEEYISIKHVMVDITGRAHKKRHPTVLAERTTKP